MVWECITYKRVVPIHRIQDFIIHIFLYKINVKFKGIMNSSMYVNIHEKNFWKYACNSLPLDFVFQQNNNLKLMPKRSRAVIKNHGFL